MSRGDAAHFMRWGVDLDAMNDSHENSRSAVFIRWGEGYAFRSIYRRL